MAGKKDLVKIKAEGLCLGIRSSKAADEIFLLQHPTIHKRTGNSGLQLLLGNEKLVLNAIYGEKFCKKSPYCIEKLDGKFWLCKNNTKQCVIYPIPAPKWYSFLTSKKRKMSDILLLEGKDTLITGIWNNCCYFSNGTQCKFCMFGKAKGIEWKNSSELKETVKAALNENPNYSLHLTGGNTFSKDRGITSYANYVKEVRKVSKKIPITLEVSPPENLDFLEKIIRLGVNGFSINIEVWDDKKRAEICPGKSKISKAEYVAAWKKCVELLGKFKASSVLIVGLDKPESIKKAIKKLVKIGIKPTLIPFRPFDKSKLNKLRPARPEELLQLSRIAGRELAKAGANAREFVGCEHCGACSVEKDFLESF